VRPELQAERAVRAYDAMRRRLARRDGLYRRDGRLPGLAAHLWPTARALAGAVDLLGVRPARRGGFDAEAAVASHLAALERYWDPARDPPAYASDVAGSRLGGDRYYDDNAWVGLTLVQLERLAPGRGHRERAAQLFAFAVSGWDSRPDAPHPGGVYWVEQGRGAGARNHDRNTVSNAPNAQLGLHLDELPGGAPTRFARAHAMYAWVNATLQADSGLFWDKLRGDGTIDRTLWTYNQGSMIGANVLLARRAVAAERARHLRRAETLAARTLEHYAGRLDRQPPAFNAILFRNLLLLDAATSDAGLQRAIRSTIETYAEVAWSRARDRHDRFRFARRSVTLLDQSAMVQIYALLAWDPADYALVA
jgi:Glycosyl hydrolase family 76